MDWYRIVFETIDMRSFSNLWFWIALAVMWSSTSHWVLGVPFDMVVRARRTGTDGPAAADLEELVRINVTRILYIAEEAGLWIVAIGSAVLTGLAVLGWVYWIEFAQACFLLGFPMSMVGLLSVVTAARIRREGLGGPAMWRRLSMHRLGTQIIGMVSIVVTALWGMFMNMSVNVLGG
ncbi:hypothetical protein [Salipiger mucosus]|uniref:Component of SufBCD complex n=1 Tax=Salipiger mucosus DSM 16094 TaxID=1123237 RepID=S9RD23_9RHOB|nr:hypothetical protein [Salipiger mucosus]EPX76020.1 hypothetical protein Salmuc_00672 [Salipiger mucosus DSM 16094]